jgi:glycosyltransferase involved in cell wall biosynthesis
MRVLYLTPGHPAHDDRFLEAITAIGHEPLPLIVGSSDADRVRRAIDEFRPDVVQAGPILPVAWLAARARAHPLITTSWAYDLLAEPAAGRDRDLTVWTLHETDVLIVDCDAAHAAASRLGMHPDRIVQLPWGVDLATFHPVSSVDRRRLRHALGWQDEVVVVTARPHEPVYGVEVVLDGFAAAATTAPDLRLLVVGDGSLTAALVQRVALRGIGEQVRFVGRKTNAEIAASLAMADIYVSASHMDGSSVTLLEAMATGLPAIASDTLGNREWVEPGINGMLFPDGDAAALGVALAEVATTSATARTAMGARGRAIAEARADWRRNRWRLADAYALGSNRDRLAST